jgi:hypothetical protein
MRKNAWNRTKHFILCNQQCSEIEGSWKDVVYLTAKFWCSLWLYIGSGYILVLVPSVYIGSGDILILVASVILQFSDPKQEVGFLHDNTQTLLTS